MSTVSDCGIEMVTSSSNGTDETFNTGYDSSTDTMASTPTVEVHKVVNTNGVLSYTDDLDGITGVTPSWYPDNPGGGLMVVAFNVTDTNMYRIRVCWEYCSGGVCSGDPHITTFGGDKYTL
jgi:hypothetical protein